MRRTIDKMLTCMQVLTTDARCIIFFQVVLRVANLTDSPEKSCTHTMHMKCIIHCHITKLEEKRRKREPFRFVDH